jgi:hypothetical protein
VNREVHVQEPSEGSLDAGALTSTLQRPVETLTPGVARILHRTQPWVRLLAICGFAMVGLMLVVAIGAGLAGIATQRVETAVLVVTYPLFALLYFFPSLYLLRYASRIRDFVVDGEPRQLEFALDAQRAFWKFTGILTLVSLGIAALALMIGLVVGLAAGMALFGS